MFNFFKQLTPLFVPKPRSLYAYTKFRRGDFLLFIKEERDTLEFMQLPSLFQIFFTQEEFAIGVKEKLFELVECLPEEVFDVCVCNMQKNP